MGVYCLNEVKIGCEGTDWLQVAQDGVELADKGRKPLIIMSEIAVLFPTLYVILSWK